MRRFDKVISDRSAIDEIIRSARVCRLAFSNGATPYIVPLCFGYQENTLYFHCAPEGRKLEYIRKNAAVCFEFDEGAKTLPHENPCQWGMKYKSVIGYGRVQFVEQMEEKRRALEIIMRQYSPDAFDFPDAAVSSTTVFQIVIDEITGKQSGY